MLFQDIMLIDEHMQLRQHMYLGVQQGTISYLSQTPPPDAAAFGEIYPHSSHKLFLPGYYNAHSHAPMHLLRGYGENLNLSDWLHQRIFPFEDQLTAEDIYWSCLAGAVEMLRFGIVSTTDMYMSGIALGKAFADSGIKANFALGATGFDQSRYQELPSYQEFLSIREDFHGLYQGRLQVDLSLHAEYTSTERLVRSLSELAAELQTRMHVHVAETAAEVADCRERHQGKSPVSYLADCGIFDIPATAAHAVHIDDADIAILKEKQVSVASCPISNLKLASGICPAKKLLAAGINVALGTDSVASNNNLNMQEDIKLFALLHKGINNDPTLITPAQALYAATRAGALSQGRQDCGLLKEGYRADMIALDTDRLYWQPAHDYLANLVYASVGTDVFMTMVDGKICYEDGSFPQLDIEQLLYHNEQSCSRILQEVGGRKQRR
jgi:5-methylthioadenosine/S-adenosylhomocysteine deaminase